MTTNSHIYCNFLQCIEKKHLSFAESLSDLCGTRSSVEQSIRNTGLYETVAFFIFLNYVQIIPRNREDINYNKKHFLLQKTMMRIEFCSKWYY